MINFRLSAVFLLIVRTSDKLSIVLKDIQLIDWQPQKSSLGWRRRLKGATLLEFGPGPNEGTNLGESEQR